MSRLLPRSLLAQMALLIGAALLIAQLVNFGLILNEREKLSLAQNQGPAITRYVSVASDYVQTPADLRFAVIEDRSRRGAQFSISKESRVSADSRRDSDVESSLSRALSDAGVRVAEVRALQTTRPAPSRSRSPSARPSADRHVLVLSARIAGVGWLNGILVTPRADPYLRTRLALATLALYAIVLGATLFAVARVTRPLRDLTRAAERFGGRDTPPSVEPRGPADVRQAIGAFNAMNRRVGSLLDEKDRMLGAIGHDLRTPLASLRIRAESVEPAEERERMIATIDELKVMLEDILVLARSGRAREDARAMDVRALVETVVDEFQDLGKDAELLDGERVTGTVQPVLLRRAVRNLVDNAIAYGGRAGVSVGTSGHEIVIEVADDGPGLPPDQMDAVLEPFRRLEQSRNRETGGAGLGLAIARAVAESHGGSLELRNGEKGLVASLRLPLG